jgi:branched-chain amino acid transport system substrate-binding protein
VPLTGEPGDTRSPPPRRPADLGPGGAGAPSGAPAGTGRAGTGKVLLAAGGAIAVAVGLAAFLRGGPPVAGEDRAERVPVAAAVAPAGVRGVSDEEIRFGMASPFTGVNRELGRAMRTGIETAFAAANAGGGVHGRKLRLIARDDGYEPSRTLPVLRQLVEEEQVFAVVGNVGTPTAAVAIPYCTEHKVLFFGAFTGGDVLRKEPPDRYVFNFRPSYAEETSAAVRWLVEGRGIDPRRIAFFSQDDEFGASGWRGASAQFARHGIGADHVLRAAYRRNTVDVADAVATLRERAGEVDAVVMVATSRAAATFIRRTREAGLELVYTNVSAVDANSLAEKLVPAGPRHTRDVVVTQVVPLPNAATAAVTRFRKALAAHGPGERPGFVSFEGWIVGNLLVEGLRRAGPELDSERLVEALHGIRDLDLGIGARLGFTPSEHQASRTVWITMLQPDGSYRQIEAP